MTTQKFSHTLREETWISVSDRLPAEREEVETKIYDEKGLRNQTTLKLYQRLWWAPDMSIYVYYRPTHWRPLPAT